MRIEKFVFFRKHIKIYNKEDDNAILTKKQIKIHELDKKIKN